MSGFCSSKVLASRCMRIMSLLLTVAMVRVSAPWATTARDRQEAATSALIELFMLVNSSPAPVRQRKNIIVFVSLGPDYTPTGASGQILECTWIDTFLHASDEEKHARLPGKWLGLRD